MDPIRNVHKSVRGTQVLLGSWEVENFLARVSIGSYILTEVPVIELVHEAVSFRMVDHTAMMSMSIHNYWKT